MNILEKLQRKPEGLRRAILWSIIIILSLVLLTWWFKNSQKRLEEFQTETFIEELELKVPEMGIPEFNEEKLEEFKKQLEELETQS